LIQWTRATYFVHGHLPAAQIDDNTQRESQGTPARLLCDDDETRQTKSHRRGLCLWLWFKNRVRVISGRHLWQATGAVRQGNGKTAADPRSEDEISHCHLVFLRLLFQR